MALRCVISLRMQAIKATFLIDWYRMLNDLGRFEVEHGRTRFFEMTVPRFDVHQATQP